LWRCGDSLFFEVPPLASDALLTTFHPLLENVLQAICHKLQEDSGTGGFDLVIISKFLASELPFHDWNIQKSHGAKSGLYGRCSKGVPPISVSASIALYVVWHCLDSCSAILKRVLLK
jgi:hypothetical protein